MYFPDRRTLRTLYVYATGWRSGDFFKGVCVV